MYTQRTMLKSILVGSLALAVCIPAPCQTPSPWPTLPSADISASSSPETYLHSTDLIPPGHPQASAPPQNPGPPQQHSLVVRSVKRGLSDQKKLYLAPLEPSNLKWDALFVIGTGALVASDRQTTRALPTSHVDLFRNMTNISLGATSATLGGLWAYGIKTHDEHAKETGELELETLANTFLIYTPMQFIAGRERPEEGTGNGRFWRHGGFNTSFPAGHPMFTWAMATVAAHEYPRPWVKLLAYGAATSVSVGRFLGREHFASDVVVGSALGYLIATHIFHAHCDPERSDACHRQNRYQHRP